jgi:Amt family ammonium transporter
MVKERKDRAMRQLRVASVFVLVIGGLLLTMIPGVMAGDPSGESTYKGGIEGLAIAINFVWVLVAAFLVFFMQAGFALVGVGAIRTKNTVNYLAKSYMDFSLGAIFFLIVGFAFMFGGSEAAPGLELGNAFIGYSGGLLTGEAYDVTTSMLFLFQAMFAATAATIVAGAMAGRTKFQAYLIYTVIVTAVIYPLYGHWVWGGGWLSTLPYGVGAVDFAGSGVVHAVGGFVALAGAYLVGPRAGKYKADGTPVAIPGHNIVYIVLGTFILFFGWFGFNPGSTLAATDLRIAVIAVNTFLAGAAGAVVACYTTYFRTGKANIFLICNGALAGLVAITAPCAYVPPWAAVIIGAIAGVLVMASIWFVEWKLGVDDPVGAVSVHGVNGLWGLLAVGIFADGTYGGVRGLIVGNFGQFIAQAISVATVFIWAFGLGLLLFATITYTIGLRVSREEEVVGLDISEHGTLCYPGPGGASDEENRSNYTGREARGCQSGTR